MDSKASINLVSLGAGWGGSYHEGVSVGLLPNSADNDCFVVGSRRMRPPLHLRFWKWVCSLLRLSLSYAILQAKGRKGTLRLWVKSNAQVSLAAGLSTLFSTALLGLLLQSEKLFPYLLLGKTGLCAIASALVAFDLPLWVTIVFLKEKVVYKETRRAGGVLVPVNLGYG